jgi:hypothetical protein
MSSSGVHCVKPPFCYLLDPLPSLNYTEAKQESIQSRRNYSTSLYIANALESTDVALQTGASYPAINRVDTLEVETFLGR